MSSFTNEEMTRILLAVFDDRNKVRRYLEYASKKGWGGDSLLRLDNLKVFDMQMDSQVTATAALKNNSLIPKQYRCGFHKDAVPFTVMTLRPGTQKTELNEFLVMYFTGPAKDRDFCNGLLTDVVVCPQCFFASTEVKHFVTGSPEKGEDFENDFNPTQKTLKFVAERADERTKTARRTTGLFEPVRSFQAAFAAYELAIQSMQAIYDSSPTRFNRYPTLIAMYHLESAQICREMGDASREQECLRHAFETLKNAEELGKDNPKVFYKNIYRVVRLALHFGDDHTASRYASELVQMKLQAVQMRNKNMLDENEYKLIAGFAERAVDQLHEHKDTPENDGPPENT
jgi:hypothetical protein